MSDETLAPLPNLLEGMTAISAVLDPATRSHNDRSILTVFVDKTRMDKKSGELAFLRHRAHELGFTIEAVLTEDLDNLTSGTTHGGIVALCSERTIPALTERTADIKPRGFYVLLEGIEDPYNFGYTVRSLYAAGSDGVILPPRNWMEVTSVVARSSAGTTEKMPMWISNPVEAVSQFRALGYRIACAGIRDSIDLYNADLSLPLLLVIGGEKRGISRGVLEGSDLTVRIEYGADFRGSLPSAASAAVLAFEIMHRNKIVRE